MKRLLILGLLLVAMTFCASAHATCSNTSLGNGATCIQIASNSTGAAGAATLAVTLTVGAGHFLWVGAGTGCATGASSVAGNSNTYVQIGTDLVWVAGSKLFAYYVKSANSGSTTVTVTFGCTGQFQTLYVMEYSGLDTTAPLDQNTTFTTASNANPIVTGSLTTLSANEVLLAQGVINGVGTGTLTAGTSYTLEGTNANNSGVIEDRGVSATSGYTASFASSSTAKAAGIIFATFKVAIAGGATAKLPALGVGIILIGFFSGILLGIYDTGRKHVFQGSIGADSYNDARLLDVYNHDADSQSPLFTAVLEDGVWVVPTIQVASPARTPLKSLVN